MNDGGPVFPIPKEDWLGMTLRDWFAGQALAMLGDPKVGNPVCDPEENRNIDRRLAEACYGIADAMIEARRKS